MNFMNPESKYVNPNSALQFGFSQKYLTTHVFVSLTKKVSEKNYMKEMFLAQAFCHMVFL